MHVTSKISNNSGVWGAMFAYLGRTVCLVLMTLSLATLVSAQAHATFAELRLIKKVNKGVDKDFVFSITNNLNILNGFHPINDPFRDYNSDSTIILRPTGGAATSAWYWIEIGDNTITEN